MTPINGLSKVTRIGFHYFWLLILFSILNQVTSISSEGDLSLILKEEKVTTNPNSIPEQRFYPITHQNFNNFNVRKRKKVKTISESGSRKIDEGDVNFLSRQGGGWGWGWPSSHSGGYDVYTIIAVAAFAALFGALLYELMGGSSRRSLEMPLSLPAISLGLDSEKLPEVMVKIGDWLTNSTWIDSMGDETKSLREIGRKIGIKRWFDAFKKDPVEYQCIRKVACETLAASSLAKKSFKTIIGGVFISTFGNFIENGEQLQGLVKDVIENPKMCDDIIDGGFCDEKS